MGGIKCLTSGHHGPDNSNVLVGQCNGRDIPVPSPDEIYEPSVLLLSNFGITYDRSGTMNQ